MIVHLTISLPPTDQGDHSSILGEGSNAIVWPKGPSEDDEEMEEVERYDNQRLMRIGKHLPSNRRKDDIAKWRPVTQEIPPPTCSPKPRQISQTRPTPKTTTPTRPHSPRSRARHPARPFH